MTAGEAGGPSGALSVRSLPSRILRGSGWVMGGRAVTLVLGVVINKLLAKILTPTELGAYFTAFTMMMVGSSIGQLGLDRAVIRLVAAARGVGQDGKARQAITIVFRWGTLGAVGVALILGLGTGEWLAIHVYHSPLVAALIPLTAGWIVAAAIQSLVVETLRGLQRFAASTLFDALLVDIIAATVFAAIFVLSRRINVHGVLALSVGFTVVAAIAGGLVLLPRVRILKGDGTTTRGEVFQIAWPLLVTNISIYLLGTGMDLLVLNAFVPLRTVALYGAASRLTLLVATPFTILQGVTPPIVAELHAQGKRSELESSLRAMATLAGIPTLLILIVFLLLGRQVLGILYAPFYEQAAPILAVLSLARLVAVWTGSCGVALMMTGHQRAMMYLTIGTGACSLGLGILLAPHFGALGVAAATSSAQVTQNLVQLFLAKRLVGVWTYVYLTPKPFLRFFRNKTGKGGRS